MVYRNMNLGIGNEAAQSNFWEYLFRIFSIVAFAVQNCIKFIRESKTFTTSTQQISQQNTAEIFQTFKNLFIPRDCPFKAKNVYFSAVLRLEKKFAGFHKSFLKLLSSPVFFPSLYRLQLRPGQKNTGKILSTQNIAAAAAVQKYIQYAFAETGGPHCRSSPPPISFAQTFCQVFWKVMEYNSCEESLCSTYGQSI